MAKKLLMGNEAFAHAALEAGVNVVAGYPGTPSSEVIETIARLHKSGKAEGVYVEWSTNEKAALEFAAAAAMSGARALFTCKQVGLNVASDALMSLNYVGVRGGLVIFVADDPGPISSQTEQDTRRFAAFAKVPVLDPATPEQGAEMIKQAFKLSEEHKTPVIVRPTTRIDHASTFFDVKASTRARALPEGGFKRDPEEWVIFPKRAYRAHGDINKRLQSMAHEFTYDPDYTRFNEGFEKLSNGMARPLAPLSADFERPGAPGITGNLDGPFDASTEMGLGDPQILKAFTGANTPTLGIVASGVSTQYALEALQIIEDLASKVGVSVPSYRFMQIGTPYPFPRRLVGRFLKDLSDVLVIEELDSVIEEDLLQVAGRSFLSPSIHGKLTDEANTRGENSTEDAALRIAYFFDKYRKQATSDTNGEGLTLEALVEHKLGPNALLQYPGKLPVRAPVLCAGCPHRGSFYAMKRAVQKLKISREDAVFCGDIGCYTLGNANPLDAVDTCLCMGAGITMAQGFAQTNPGKKNIAFVGDSTFFASGMTGIANAVYNQHDITICILDNSTTAMTGSQPHPGTGVTLMGPKSQPIDIAEVLKALGVKDIVHVDPLDLEASQSACIEALENPEPSAIIFKSPCVWLEPFGTPARVNQNTCTGCKKCITEIGCPAIAFDHDAKGPKSGHRGQAYIDISQCNGCGLCIQVCPFSSIHIVTPEEEALYESASRATGTSGANAPGSVDLSGSDSKRSSRSGGRSTNNPRKRAHADIGDDKVAAEDMAEPDEAVAKAADALEDSFEDVSAETGYTSTNIYGDLDALMSGSDPNAVSLSSRVAKLGKGFTGTIGLDAIGSDFDGFVDSLINGLAATYEDYTEPDQHDWPTYHYYMKERSYRPAPTVRIQHEEAADDDALDEATVSGGEGANKVAEVQVEDVEVGRVGDAGEQDASDQGVDEVDDTLDVFAALNSSVFIELDDDGSDDDSDDDDQDDEDAYRGSASGRGRKATPKRREDGKRHMGSGEDASPSKRKGGTSDEDAAQPEEPKKSKPVVQSRWGGRG